MQAASASLKRLLLAFKTGRAQTSMDTAASVQLKNWMSDQLAGAAAQAASATGAASSPAAAVQELLQAVQQGQALNLACCLCPPMYSRDEVPVQLCQPSRSYARAAWALNGSVFEVIQQQQQQAGQESQLGGTLHAFAVALNRTQAIVLNSSEQLGSSSVQQYHCSHSHRALAEQLYAEAALEGEAALSHARSQLLETLVRLRCNA